jgi:hypothetical protein
MRKQNRLYKRGEPHRDSSFFVIVCEGADTEIKYFENFQKIEQQRVKIVPVAPPDNLSAPKWVLDQAVKKAEEIGLNEDDQLWIVTDTDRWKFEHLRTIQDTCERTKNWNFVVSNPCFEVWLHAHVQDLENLSTTNRNELKRQFGLLKNQGLFNNPLQNIKLAIERAKRLDNSPHFMPEPMRTKVYLLVEALIKRIGNHHFE